MSAALAEAPPELAAAGAQAMAPGDEADLAAILRDAREPIAVQGNATKEQMLRPVQAARSLSTRGLTGITLHAPKELVISARAGTTLADLQAAIAAHGQHIIAEPPDFSALFGSAAPQTLGGVVATNLSGPRRVAWGAMRDHVIGVRAVNGAGEIIRSGGRVLKNVTGLDLCKLLTGSHGTLAVLSEITLKVLPKPERQATLVLRGLDPARGVAALAAALGSPFSVSGAAYLPREAAARIAPLAWLDGPVAIARLEDFASFTGPRAEKLRADLADFGRAEMLDEGASEAVWRAVRDAAPLGHLPQAAIWRVSVRPSAGPAVVAALAGAEASWFMDWGGGLVWIAAPATEGTHKAICRAAEAGKGAWQLFRAAAPLRNAVAVVPPEPAALARITRNVKQAFDPRGILNPGRIYAGL
jgi:glycolate oxidase FAD binding subunit